MNNNIARCIISGLGDKNKGKCRPFNMSSAFNNTTSISQAQSCAASETNSTILKVIKTILFSLIMVAAFLGNVFIILIVYKKKNMRRTTNIFIANMAASDIFIAVVVIPTILAELYIGPRVWLVDGAFGTFLCKLCFAFTDWSVCISVTSHAVIAFDRFWAIVYSLRPTPITPARRKYIIAVIWLYGFLLHSPNWYIYKLHQMEEKTLCLPNWSPMDAKTSSNTFFAIIFIFVICVPVFLMVILYSGLIISLNIHSKQLPDQASEVRKQRRKEDIRVLRKVVAMLTVFLLSLVPLSVFALLTYYVWDGRLPCHAWNFSFAAYVLFLSNSAVNPWLCIGLHDSYKHYIRKTFFSWRHVMTVPSPSLSTKFNEIELNTQATMQRYEHKNEVEARKTLFQELN